MMTLFLSVSSEAIYARLKSTGILDDYIVKGYDVLHTFGKEYLMEDLMKKERFRGSINKTHNKSRVGKIIRSALCYSQRAILIGRNDYLTHCLLARILYICHE